MAAPNAATMIGTASIKGRRSRSLEFLAGGRGAGTVNVGHRQLYRIASPTA